MQLVPILGQMFLAASSKIFPRIAAIAEARLMLFLARAQRPAARATAHLPARRRAHARCKAVPTAGWTNCETSPPRLAISRTRVDEMKLNCSVGVMKT